MAVVSMSEQEFSRLEVLLRVQSGGLRVADACVLIDLRRRQVFRLLRGLKQNGAASLLSKRRGKPSNHRLPAEVRTLALSLVRERYADFGPTLAAEKLAAHHGCKISRETLRGWMIADGLWTDRRHRLPSPHQPRRRRDCLGELVQIDGSEHAWFEDRGTMCTLLAFVDDATSRLMLLRFVASESAFRDAAAHQRFRERHPLPGHAAQDQRRYTQRSGAGVPRYLPRPRQDLHKARRGILGLSRHPPPGPGTRSHSTPARTRPLPWTPRVIPAHARGFAPATHPGWGPN